MIACVDTGNCVSHNQRSSKAGGAFGETKKVNGPEKIELRTIRKPLAVTEACTPRPTPGFTGRKSVNPRLSTEGN